MKNPLFTALFMLTAVTAQAVNLTGIYSEDFNSMGTAGVAAPVGWTFHSIAGVSGDWATSVVATGVGGGTANAALIASTTTTVSSSSAGYNFALAAATADRALATSPTGIKGAALQLTVTNTSGGPLNGIHVGYDTRRFSASGGNNELPGFWLFYSLDSGGSWTNVPAFNPTITTVPNTTGVTVTAPTLVTFSSPLANNSTVLFRWVDDNSQTYSPDQITGLDNVVLSTQASTTLIAKDSVWKYLDDGSDQGTEWRATAFNDSAWSSGAAELGYADSPATVVGYGPDSNNKYIGTYFRSAFTVANPATVSSLVMNLVRDDGAVIYLNGTEIARSNMNAGSVLYNTLAPSPAVGNADESTYFPVTFSVDPVPLLVAGTNVVAVEVHQQAATSSDLSFNLELSAQTIPVGNPPSVAIQSPSNSATFTAPATVEITANAADTDGTISTVEFFQGGTKLGEDASAPYAFTTNGLAAGNYSLTARATDNDGNVAVSSAVAITVLAGPSGSLVRGPYLNMPNQNSIVVRWRSSQSIIGRVRYGLAPDALNLSADESAAQTDHVVRLTGLSPYTRYYYSVGSATDSLTPEAAETTSYTPGAPAPSAADYTFRTAPVPGTAVDTRIWIVGDCGRGTQVQANGRNAYYSSTGGASFTGSRIPDLNLQMGDNAYTSGTDVEYQTGYFNMYANIFRKMPQWSTLGNHDANNGITDPLANFPYFDMFTFPTAGECGGVGSGTEHYYSFDYGNIHFICLDSQASVTTVDNPATTGVNEDGPMAIWLRQDLASTISTWIIAFWHHPPYSKGSHNSDTEGRMVNMRTNFNPILENGGVDLVFLGHSHNYERSVLLDGHYGTSETLTAAMKKNSGNGSTSGFTTTANGKIRNAANGFIATDTIAGAVISADGAYIKPLTGPRDHFGAVYNTAGMSGLADTGAIDHSAMYVSYNNVGTVNLDVNGNSLTCTFVQSGGATPDNFTITKQGEADTDGDGMSDAYEIANGLSRYTEDAATNTDSDSLSNFLEFAFGLNPNLNDSGFMEADISNGLITKRGSPSPWYQTSVSGTDFRVIYIRRKDAAAAGLVYAPQFSRDLIIWTDSAATPTVIADGGEVEAVSVEYPLFPAGQDAGFFRLGVHSTH
jgi:hypothetical protein